MLVLLASASVTMLYQINLRNSAPRWLSLYEYITVHGPLNVKFTKYFPSTQICTKKSIHHKKWKAETCRCFDLLIIFYLLNCVLDCKIIYILSIIDNTTGMPQLKTSNDIWLQKRWKNILYLRARSFVESTVSEEVSASVFYAKEIWLKKKKNLLRYN